MVEFANGGRRPQERPHAVLNETDQHEHVVALVGVPAASGRQVVQAQDRGEPDNCH